MIAAGDLLASSEGTVPAAHVGKPRYGEVGGQTFGTP